MFSSELSGILILDLESGNVTENANIFFSKSKLTELHISKNKIIVKMRQITRCFNVFSTSKLHFNYTNQK